MSIILYERAPNFEALGLSSEACDGMERIRPGKPPGRFMSWALPRLIAGRDMNGTVSDVDYKKTIAAYLVTIFEKLNKHRGSYGGVRALILTATGDMASRTFDLAQKLFTSTDIVVVYLNGGENELERLDHQKPDVLIVTPDTLIHHLSSSSSAAADDGILSLRSVELLVIDGASEMLLRRGFVDHLKKIVGQLRDLDRQTLLFTTQSTAAVCVLAKKILRNPLWMRPSTTHEMFDKVASLCLGEVQEKPCVEKPNTILQQDTCRRPRTRHCSDDAKKKKKKEKMMMKEKKNKKKATHDGIEEAGSCNKRARDSMDVD